MHMAIFVPCPGAAVVTYIFLSWVSLVKGQQQPWSPIVGGHSHPIIPPTVPPPVFVIHSAPLEKAEVITKSLPKLNHGTEVKSLRTTVVKSLHKTPVKSLYKTPVKSLYKTPVKSLHIYHEDPVDQSDEESYHGHQWTVPHRSRARRKKWRKRLFRRPAYRDYRVYNSPYRDSPYKDRWSGYGGRSKMDYGARGRGKVRQYRGVDNGVRQYVGVDSGVGHYGGVDTGQYRGVDNNGLRRQDDEGRSFVRNLFGSPNHCLEEGRQYSCTFTPVCWLTGGVASAGCDSWMYSCCRPPSIGRKDKDVFEKRTRDLLENEPECGISRHRQFSKRIIGGEKAKFAELPWQAHIRISSYQCGGVLLNHWYVATAAHCVHRAKLHKISVHLGEYDTKDTEDTEEPLDSHSYKVDHIIIHPDFRYMLTQPDRYDVALLHLDRPVFYQDNIIPICLPPGDIGLYGKVGIVAGWGKTDNSFGKTGTNILHKVLVPIIKNKDCIRWHEDKNILVQLHDEMFCAGHKKGKMDACLGDSGGPLVIHYNGRWTLIGITSAGFGCAVDKQPGIYHKIGKTTHWILTQINP